MILNGKEIQVLLGVVIVFQEIPLSHTVKRKLSESEDNCLETLLNKLINAAENEYKKVEAENYIDKSTIERRLDINVTWSFTEAEVTLLKEAFKIYIDESKARKDGTSLNVYYGGDQYQLDLPDFETMYNRF